MVFVARLVDNLDKIARIIGISPGFRNESNHYERINSIKIIIFLISLSLLLSLPPCETSGDPT